MTRLTLESTMAATNVREIRIRLWPYYAIQTVSLALRSSLLQSN